MTSPKPLPPTLIMRSLNLLLMSSFFMMLISGLVLLLDGHMAQVWPPFMLLVLGQLIFPFILLPAGLMAGLWHALHAHHAKLIVRIFAVASVAYIAAILSMTVWLQAYLVSRLPADQWGIFTEMFIVSGAVAPWAVFALRDRRNQLFIILLWAMTAGAVILLPLKMMGGLSNFTYGFGVWLVMLVIMTVENARENSRARQREAALRAQKIAPTAPPTADGDA